MKTLTIPWKDTLNSESKQAIEMSIWCKQMGLTHNMDYTWRLDNARRQTLFTFRDDRASMVSMFILKYGRYGTVL